MHREIAVFLGSGGETIPLDQKGLVVIYGKKYGKWTQLRQREFDLGQATNIRELRQLMGEMVAFLQMSSCRIFVGAEVTGIPFFELEKNHYHIWEYQGEPEDFLEDILSTEKEKERQQCGCNPGQNGDMAAGGQGKIDIEPKEVSPGCYYLSLTQVQGGATGVTSKQVLLPFLRQGSFYSLQVECSHVPRWLEAELLSGSIHGEVLATTDKTIINISKNTCS